MSYEPDKLQKIALGLMSGMVLLTFTLANVHALLWQSSDWLVGAVLPSTVIELTNDERQDNNASPLRRSAVLDAAASMKAQHMAEKGYFAHFAPDGTSPWYWFDQAGYTYAHAGENLAIHFTDSDEVVEAWMNSPTHRANIVDGKFTEIGVGTAKGRYDGHRTVYVVQLFGTPAYVPPTPTPTAVTPSASPALASAAETTPTVAPAETPAESTTVLAAEDDSGVAESASEVTAETASEGSTAEIVAENEVQAESAAKPVQEPVTTVTSQAPESSTISVSSGLPQAPTETITTQTPITNLSFLSLATQPNTMMQVAYTLVALAVFVLLVLSFVNEMKHAHPVQMGYSVALLLLMVSLYWLHTTLTEGAIVV